MKRIVTFAIIAILIGTVLVAGCTSPKKAPVTTCEDVELTPRMVESHTVVNGTEYVTYTMAENVTVQTICKTVTEGDSNFDLFIKSIFEGMQG